jgi:quinol monooxygenase YgiN
MTKVGFAVIMKARQGKETELESIFAKLAGDVRAREPRNIFYEFMKVTDEPRCYVLMEQYENEEAAITHSKSAHFIDAQPSIGPLLEIRPIVHRLISC